jgi:hypothetical protein
MKLFIWKFEKNRPYHSREMKKMKYFVWAIKKILKWKNYGKIIFEIWNEIFIFEIWNKFGHTIRGKWKILK